MKKRENLRCIGLKIHQIVISGFGVLLALFIIISLIVIMDTNTASANYSPEIKESLDDYITVIQPLNEIYVVDNGNEVFHSCNLNTVEFNNYSKGVSICYYRNYSGYVEIYPAQWIDKTMFQAFEYARNVINKLSLEAKVKLINFDRNAVKNGTKTAMEIYKNK